MNMPLSDVLENVSTDSSANRLDLSSFQCVVIDDKEEDALAILWGLQAAGLSCTPLVYDGMNGLRNAREHHLEATRIIFLDLNLAIDSTSSIQTLASHIGMALKELRLVGPYLLVIWSNFNANPSEVLPQAFKQAGVPCPIGIEEMQKEQFWNRSEGDSWDSSKIGIEVNEMLERHPQIKALMAWESRIYAAARSATEILFSTARKPCQSSCLFSALAQKHTSTQPPGGRTVQSEGNLEEIPIPVNSSSGEQTSAESQLEDRAPEETLPSKSGLICGKVASGSTLSEVLCAIAKASFGEHAQIHSPTAIEAGLLPLIEDRLLATKVQGEYATVWRKTLETGWESPLADSEKGVLNTYLLLDCSLPPISDRGVWFDWQGAPGNPLGNLFGNQVGNLLTAFINLESLNKGNESEKAAARQIRASCRVGLLECSAACDHAWDKAKSRLGLLAAIIPAAVDSKYIRPDQGIYKLPLFRLEEKDCRLMISFRHVCGIVPKTMGEWIKSKRVLFRIREQLLGDVAAHFAAHITRPGTISLGGLPIVSHKNRE